MTLVFREATFQYGRLKKNKENKNIISIKMLSGTIIIIMIII